MIQIRFENSSKSFRCGEPIRGTVDWSGTEPQPERLEIRLVWYTLGKGDRDMAVITVKGVPVRMDGTSAEFEFVAPHSPYSFSGKLISVVWAVEAELLPQRNSESVSIVVGPQAREIIGTPSKNS